MNRAEHLGWCKRRALEYVDAGQLDQALSSMVSDLAKHPDLDLGKVAVGPALQAAGFNAMLRGQAPMRAWIKGFC